MIARTRRDLVVFCVYGSVLSSGLLVGLSIALFWLSGTTALRLSVSTRVSVTALVVVLLGAGSYFQSRSRLPDDDNPWFGASWLFPSRAPTAVTVSVVAGVILFPFHLLFRIVSSLRFLTLDSSSESLGLEILCRYEESFTLDEIDDMADPESLGRALRVLRTLELVTPTVSPEGMRYVHTLRAEEFLGAGV